MLSLYNSLTKKKERFTPINPPQVGLYTCGMTVYDYAHIGHGRKYVGDDILRRALTYFGYEVNHIQNVTDVGHLVSDADEGEDKLEKGARKAGKTVWEVAEFYTDHFYSTLEKLNILTPSTICKATEHIPEQIELVEKLIENGLAYDTPEAVYFDIEKYPQYTQLFNQNLDDKQTAAREDVETGSHKKNTADFALWFKRVGRFKNHVMHWDSPWGDGFPGWHVECSAMSMKYLGETFDIHTGGIDHLSVHHPNEIAQSQGATGKSFATTWIHHGFLTIDGRKMSKSLENFFQIEDVEERGFSPIALRYFYLTAHYRRSQNFTWEALQNADNALKKLQTSVGDLNSHPEDSTDSLTQQTGDYQKHAQSFKDAIGDDLNMPQALAVLWDVIKSQLSPLAKKALVLEFDQIFGLNLKDTPPHEQHIDEIPKEIATLAEKRHQYKHEQDYANADRMRREIENKGYVVADTPDGSYQIKLQN